MKLLSFICAALSACMLFGKRGLCKCNGLLLNVHPWIKYGNAATLLRKAGYSKFDKMYAASSQGTLFVENNVAWKLGSLYIRAHSIEEAIAIGQNRAAKVSQVLYQSATKRDPIYLCLYYDDTLQNPYISVMAHARV